MSCGMKRPQLFIGSPGGSNGTSQIFGQMNCASPITSYFEPVISLCPVKLSGGENEFNMAAPGAFRLIHK